jgi:nitrate reductase beta subunit
VPVVEGGWPTGPCATVVGSMGAVGVVDVDDIDVGVVNENPNENELVTKLVVEDEEV